MKKSGLKYLMLILVVFAVAAAATSAMAEEMAMDKAASATSVVSVAAPVTSTISGEVTAVDVHSQLPTLKVKDMATSAETTLAVDSAAGEVWKAGSKMAWSDVKVGQKVKVRHMKKGDKDAVKTVGLLS